LEATWAQAANPTAIRKYFEKLESVIETKQIPITQIYNMDETGRQLSIN
jgi:hypothetical protein